jgi:hypothetical protein
MHVHNYQVIRNTKDSVVEVCSECKKKLVTKIGLKGRIDNITYLKEHVRDTAQKTGSTAKIFKRFYGEGGK